MNLLVLQVLKSAQEGAVQKRGKMKFVIAQCLAVLGFVGFLVFVSPETRGQKQMDEEPTPVKKGQSTVEEIEYGKEYQKLYGGIFVIMKEKLSEPAASGTIRNSTNYEEAPYFFGNEPEDAAQFLSKQACKADAIVIGTAKTKTAHLTEDETFVYTKYEFGVKEVLKDNSSYPISPNDVIAVTRPGGSVKLDGQTIRVNDENVKPLELKMGYLLFLRYIPTVNGYIYSDADADFAIEGSTARSMSRPGGAPPDLRNGRPPLSQLSEQVLAAKSAVCK